MHIYFGNAPKCVKWLHVEADRDKEVILCWYHIMGYGSC